MPNNLLWLTTIAENIKTQIVAIRPKDDVKLYDTTLSLVRGKYGYNVLPTDFETREISGSSSLPDMKVSMFCYYTMDSEEKRAEEWVKFLIIIDKIRDALLSKANIPEPMATVKIDVNFHDDLLDQKAGNRAINCVMLFTYQKYGFDA